MNRYIIPVLLVLLSVGVYITYLDPLYAAVTAGNTKIAEYDKLLADAKEASEKIHRLESTQAAFPAGYDELLATILPAHVDPLKLVIDIDGIAALRGLRIKSPTVAAASDPKKTGGVSRNVLTFTVSAPYPVFKSFLRDLESDLALQDLSQLTFSSVSEDTATKKITDLELKPYEYRVSIVTYSLPK